PIATGASGLAQAAAPRRRSDTGDAKHAIAIRNGWITLDGRILVGKQMSVPWWRGSVRADDIARAEPALTRFVPGRDGNGLTDRLDNVAEAMNANGVVSIFQH